MTSDRFTIGVLTPYTGGFYYGAILLGLQRAATIRGATVVAIQTTGMDLCWPQDVAEDYLAIDAIDGWIAVNEFLADRFTAELVARRLPIVYVNARPDSTTSCSVLPDNYGGTKAAVAHLIEHGHRRISFAGNTAQFDLKERLAGYLAAHAEAGIEADPRLHLSSTANLELDGNAIGRKLIDLGLPCTAVVAGTDKVALGILSELRRAGIEVPAQIALVGFDDIEDAQHADPPLTTVRQSFDQIASLAIERLISHLETGVALPSVIRAPAPFIRRKSCGCYQTDSLPSTGPVDDPSQFVDRLTDALLIVAGTGQQSLVLPAQWPAARTIAELLSTAIAGIEGGSCRDLNALWTDFLRYGRGPDRIDRVVHVLESFVRDWAPHGGTQQRVQALLRDLRVSLLRNWHASEQDRTRYYEHVAETNGKINNALSTLRAAAAMDLSWLCWSNVQYGCVGIWNTTPSGDRVLEIVGEYGAEGDPARLGESQFKPAEFPPEQTRGLCHSLGDTNVLSIVPLTGRAGTHGLLAVAAPIEIELLDHVGNVGDWAAQVGALLERAEVDQQLKKHADHDALTGLPNRSLFLSQLQSSVQERPEFGIAVALVDLDDFKVINDSKGHAAGDQLLVEVARRLSNVLEASGIVARLGGDEFAFLVPEVEDEASALIRVNSVQEALRAPFSIDGDSVFVSCSIGVAFGKPQEFSPNDLLRDADTAMHRAKLRGHAQCEVFEHDMHAQAVERLRLDSRLRQALQRDEFVLAYQPTLSLATRSITSAEALIRWNHPDHGCLAPARFLSIAEEVGLAIPVGEWVVRHACRQAKAWQRDGHSPFRVNVNVPAEQLEDPQFVRFVERTLDEVGLSPHALGLEIVESSLINHRETTVRVLAHLLDMGIQIAIDDFGTGYSSLSYLKDFPASILKIDRSFVQNVPSAPKDCAIVIAIITMGHGLGLTVVAEGVESEDQLEFLQAHGCDLIQGYLVSRPLLPSECERFLLEDRPRHSERRASERAYVTISGSDRPRSFTPAGGIPALR